MIEFDIKKTLYGSTGIIDLSIQAKLLQGIFSILFGPSGAGKTTVLRILTGLTSPDSGKIVVDGEVWFDSAKKINLPTQQRSIGLMFQDYALFPNLNVRQNIGYALSKGDESWLKELIEFTGLVALQNQMPKMLSGGQKQRVALARAIARKPRLLLLDEPLSSLDIELRAQLQDTLLSLHQRLGLTTLMVSHDLGEIFKLAQHVLCIGQGRVVKIGTPAEVFLQNRLAYKLQLTAQVLALRQEDVIYILSLLIGSEIVEVVVSREEAYTFKPGEIVSMTAKSFSPLIFKRFA